MADDVPAELAAIKERADAATPGPWWFDEDDNVWRLHGVHAIIPPFMEGFPEQVMNHQILKAPKTGTPYAEYWPGEADAAFIVAARTDVPRLLAALDAALKLADKYDAEAKRLWGRIRDADRMGVMTGTASIDAAWNGDAAKAIREAIARKLTGKAANHG